jgi:hypothetical protein
MALLEKLVTILTVLMVLASGALVTLFSLLKLKESGYDPVAITATIKMTEWIENAGKVGPASQAPVLIDVNALPIAERPIAARNAAPVNLDQIAKETKATDFDRYVATSGESLPKDEAVPNIPWVRYQPGVTYVKPRTIPEVLHQKLQHFPDAYQAAQKGGGELEETPYGNAWHIKWLDTKGGGAGGAGGGDENYLANLAGLRSGDKIISVNGHKIGNSFTAARQLYDQLRNEKQFAVKILRGGKPTVLSFSVK